MQKKILILIAFVSVLFVSCESWLDVNDNPNSATTVKPEYLYSGAVTAYSANRIGGDGFIPIGFGSQMWSSGGMWGNAGDSYIFSPYSTGNCFSIVYGTAGKNLYLAVEEAKKNVPVQTNTIAQCMIFSAQTFFQNTLVYGDIPMRESFKLDINRPKYDSQEQVLDSIIQSLDAAVAMITDDETAITTNDLVYKGDMVKWAKYAMSLKFKTLMYMVDQKPEYKDQIVAMLGSTKMISSQDDNFAFPYFDEAGNRHSMWSIGDKWYSEGVDDMYLTPATADIMLPTLDPRIDVFFIQGEKAEGEWVPCKPSVKATKASAYYNAANLGNPDQEDVMFSYSEQLLLEAEAHWRFGDKAKAKTKFKEGIKASCKYWKIEEATITNFVDNMNLPDNDELALKMLHEQQWVDLLPRPIEGWSNWRRSGDKDKEIPKLTVPINAYSPDLFRRWPYPQEERAANQDNMPNPIPELYDPMWFDK